MDVLHETGQWPSHCHYHLTHSDSQSVSGFNTTKTVHCNVQITKKSSAEVWLFDFWQRICRHLPLSPSWSPSPPIISCKNYMSSIWGYAPTPYHKYDENKPFIIICRYAEFQVQIWRNNTWGEGTLWIFYEPTKPYILLMLRIPYSKSVTVANLLFTEKYKVEMYRKGQMFTQTLVILLLPG